MIAYRSGQVEPLFRSDRHVSVHVHPTGCRADRRDFDAASSHAIRLGQQNSQHAVFELSRDPVTIDFVAQDKRAVVISQAIFLVNESRVFRHARLDPRIQIQNIVFELDVQTLLGRAGNVRLEDQAIGALVNVDRRCIRLPSRSSSAFVCRLRVIGQIPFRPASTLTRTSTCSDCCLDAHRFITPRSLLISWSRSSIVAGRHSLRRPVRPPSR